MKYEKALTYDKAFIEEHIMGLNPIKLLEELQKYNVRKKESLSLI